MLKDLRVALWSAVTKSPHSKGKRQTNLSYTRRVVYIVAQSVVPVGTNSGTEDKKITSPGWGDIYCKVKLSEKDSVCNHYAITLSVL